MQPAVVELLLTNGVDPDASTRDGESIIGKFIILSTENIACVPWLDTFNTGLHIARPVFKASSGTSQSIKPELVADVL